MLQAPDQVLTRQPEDNKVGINARVNISMQY